MELQQLQQSPTFKTSAEQKRKAQNLAKRIRLGEPKLRDLLREKCRARIMTNRKNCLDKNRALQLEELTAILRMELNELEQDILMEEQVYDELLNDINEWYALEMQKEELSYAAELEDPESGSSAVLCPVCLLRPLKRTNSTYKCECEVEFSHKADVEELRLLLEKKIGAHEENCTQALRFFIEPTERALNALCGNCDYYCSI